MRSFSRAFFSPAMPAALLLPAFLAACSLFGSPAAGDAGAEAQSASVTLRFSEDVSGLSGHLSARSVLPDVSAAVSSFALDALGPGGATLSLSSSFPWLRGSFAPGSWDLSVRGLNASGLVLLSGSARLLAEPGKDQELTLVLAPRAGEGSLALSFSAPAVLSAGTVLELELADATGAVLRASRLEAPFPALRWTALPSGYLGLRARLLPSGSGPASWGLAECVRLLPDTETSFLVDFSAGPASASLRCALPAAEPLSPRLPAWTALSAARPLPLAWAGLDAGCFLSWCLDGTPLDAASPPAPAPGVRRLDLAARSADGLAGGSSFLKFGALPGYACGAWTWLGAFAPSADACAALPGTNGFAALAAAPSAAGSALLYALDYPAPDSGVSGSSARSALFAFSVSAQGTPWPLWSKSLVAASLPRAADNLAAAPDASWVAAWKPDASWLALSRAGADYPGPEWRLLDASSLGEAGTWRVKAARFSADSRLLLVLVGSAPYRVLAFSLSGAPALAWSLSLDAPVPASAAFSSFALAPDGALLALSASSDLAAYYAPAGEGRAPAFSALLKRSAGGPAWLDAPCAAVSVDASSFYVLCPGSRTLGRLVPDGSGGLSAGALLQDAFLAGAARLEASPDGRNLAAFESASAAKGGARLLVCSCDASSWATLGGAGAPEVFSGSSGGAWLAPGRLAAADAYSRSVSALVSD